MTLNPGQSVDCSSPITFLNNGENGFRFAQAASQQLMYNSVKSTVLAELPLYSMITDFDTVSPNAVVFNNQVYAFYVLEDEAQICYDVYSPKTGWTVAGVISLPAGATGSITTSVVFTPPESNNSQLFVFAILSGTADVFCVTTEDGSNWTQVDNLTLTLPSQTQVALTPTAVVYQAPGASAPQVYVFLSLAYDGTSGSGTGATFSGYRMGYCVYPDSSGGLGPVVEIPNTSYNATLPGSAVTFTPSGSDQSLIYLFYPGGPAYPIETWYTTFNGTAWASTSEQVPNLTVSGGVTAAVFPPASFLYRMASSDDIYLSYVNADSAPCVTSLSLCAANTTVPPIVDSPDGGTALSNGTLLPVMLSGNAVPSAWSFYGVLSSGASGQSIKQLCYGSYDATGWTANTLMTIEPTCSPSAVQYNGLTYLFSNTNANELCFSCYDGVYASPLVVIPDILLIGSAAAVVFNGVLYVFYQGINSSGNGDGQLWYATSSNGQLWSAPAQVTGAALSQSPSAAVFDGRLYVVYQGSTAGQLWCNTFMGASWNPPSQIIPAGSTASAAVLSGSPFAIQEFGKTGGSSQLMVFYTSASSSTLAGCALGSGGTWTTLQLPAITLAGPPAGISLNGSLYLFYAAAGSDAGQLWYTSFDGESWATAAQLGTATTMAGAASAVLCTVAGSPFPSVCVFHNNSGNSAGQITYTQVAYLSQGTDTVGNTGVISSDVSAIVFNDTLWAFYQGAGSSLGQLCYVTAPSSSLDSSGELTFGSSTAIVPSGMSAGVDYMSGPPAAIVYPPEVSATASNPSQLYVFYQGLSNGELMCCVTPDGTTWNSEPLSYDDGVSMVVATIPTSSAPFAAISNGTLYVSTTNQVSALLS
ncbi:hypothetical protein PQQ64_19760 [Paraburkholderia graminis]|uniref:hypothetical protein n=1 Tax=Paraburkholderia graminis TaxID=60548 RepID=UPI0038BC034B